MDTGIEWLAVRQAKVEGRARQASEGVCTTRRLATPEEALVPVVVPSALPVQLQQTQATLREGGERGAGPSLSQLALLSHVSVQLYPPSQIEASFRLGLRLQRLFVDSAPARLPATDWEALLQAFLPTDPKDSLRAYRRQEGFLTQRQPVASPVGLPNPLLHLTVKRTPLGHPPPCGQSVCSPRILSPGVSNSRGYEASSPR